MITFSCLYQNQRHKRVSHRKKNCEKSSQIGLLHLKYTKYYRGTTVQTRKSSRRLKRASGRSGVYVQILRGGAQTHLPHAFMIGLKSGHVGVFERQGKSRLPIREDRTITVASMFQQEQVYDPAVKVAGKVWADEFTRQLTL